MYVRIKRNSSVKPHGKDHQNKAEGPRSRGRGEVDVSTSSMMVRGECCCCTPLSGMTQVLPAWICHKFPWCHYHDVHCVLDYGANNTLCLEFHNPPSVFTVVTKYLLHARTRTQCEHTSLRVPFKVFHRIGYPGHYPLKSPDSNKNTSHLFRPFRTLLTPDRICINHACPPVPQDATLMLPTCTQAVHLRKVGERRNVAPHVASSDTYKGACLGLRAYN
ncbi:uncharacterized protein F5891DRAFT_1052342 [Suillus fuscotomentosus]|uniref:Uncharacterized protein n=1 Tax=Suillus fuscotomentosus TaxID=1912939 RepID=A0AAD4HIK1_9AGAM|nr:uncharacterized protein F5891DRAFT_1052342 [Suillus fuscotomentosus]KAG1896819.1 hypothetical protein F5891DRAFT_1052342 [Suillus fuscotomentosus]